MAFTMVSNNAGFDIIAYSVTRCDGGTVEGVALAAKNSRYSASGREFVTWAFNNLRDGVSFFWGHYINDERAARADYAERMARGY